MEKVLVIDSKGGFNSFLKITSILNRKRFNVNSILMKNLNQELFQVEVTFDNEEFNFQQAVNYLNKIEDVLKINLKGEVM